MRITIHRTKKGLYMSYNKVVLVGNLTKDVEVRQTKDNKIVGILRLAVDGQKKNDTIYVDVAFFGKSAETAVQYLSKGRKVLIEGKLGTSVWTDKHEQKRVDLEVIGFEWTFLDKKKEEA